jgi:hypothetical protein
MAKKTLFAVFDAASKVTENIGKGMAALSMDRSYQQQQTGETLGHVPKTFVKGFQYGPQSFVRNVKKSVSGFVVRTENG